ncbi:MAG TPA: hypothetical protein ENI17_16015 [Pseudomonas xinjiangensis]|nr:hypothetical protein [Halopseudomonas xinjiangensis]
MFRCDQSQCLDIDRARHRFAALHQLAGPLAQRCIGRIGSIQQALEFSLVQLVGIVGGVGCSQRSIGSL